MEILLIFHRKYHQHGGFPVAVLVCSSVVTLKLWIVTTYKKIPPVNSLCLKSPNGKSNSPTKNLHLDREPFGHRVFFPLNPKAIGCALLGLDSFSIARSDFAPLAFDVSGRLGLSRKTLSGIYVTAKKFTAGWQIPPKFPNLVGLGSGIFFPENAPKDAGFGMIPDIWERTGVNWGLIFFTGMKAQLPNTEKSRCQVSDFSH